MSVDKVSLARSLVKVVNQSVSDIASSPMSLPHTPPSQQQRQVLQIDGKDEEFIEESLTKLHETFVEIIYQVKVAFSDLVTHQPAQLHNIIRYAEEAVSPSQVVRFEASTIDEFFHQIHPYYDFLDCKVVTTIANKFIDGELVQKLKEHSSLARKFRRKLPVKQIAKQLQKALANVQNLPTLEAKLETVWEEVAIEGLYVLIQHLLPKTAHSQYSLMNNIVISPGCLLLQYGIRDRSMIDTITQHVQHNIELMRLIGVFQLAVDGTPVIHEDEDPSFSFNTSLLDATVASNNAAIQCLLDIGANVNYQDDDNGVTALMLAVFINNIDIIHQLLQAGADVHIQNKNGVTALTVACAGSGGLDLPPDVHRLSDDYRDTVRLLLSHGADPLADVVVGGVPGSSFDMACGWDNIDVVEMLLTDYNIPPEAVVRGLYYALLGAVATNTIKLLQSKIPDVDPLAIKLGVSCGEGDIETVKSLIEQGVDPNTVIVHGLTPLMIASYIGHINIAETLIHHGAKVNMVDDIQHWTALDWAEINEDHDMISLLQQYGGLHSKDTPTKASQDTPINESPNEPQDTPTTNKYKIPLSFISKRFHKIRKLGGRLITFRRSKPRHNIHSNIILGPNHPVTQNNVN